MLTEEELKEAEKLLEGTTPAPWEGGYSAGAGCQVKGYCTGKLDCVEFVLKSGERVLLETPDNPPVIAYEPFIQFGPGEWHRMQDANCKFIAFARSFVPKAIETIRALQDKDHD